MITRRNFLIQSAIAAGGLATIPSLSCSGSGNHRIKWIRDGKLFSSVRWNGQEVFHTTQLLDASVRLINKGLHEIRLNVAQPEYAGDLIKAGLVHKLLKSAAGKDEDVLEELLTISNISDKPLTAEIAFTTSAQPSGEIENQQLYIPLSSSALNVDPRFSALGVTNFLKDCNQQVGAGEFQCHYLEPMASVPEIKETTALMIVPVIDISNPEKDLRVSLFTPSDQPVQFSHNKGIWSAGRQISIPPGKEVTIKCWLMLHTGNSSAAWHAFHQFAHKDEYNVPQWVYDMRVHYYDFLSAAEGENGRRGNGYESDLLHFREFHVGMATQHGYYTAIGDYMHPDRKSWLAMRGDKNGPGEMSIEKMKERIKNTRANGAKAAVYMHAALFDDASDLFPVMGDCVQVDSNGQRMNFSWTGPDTAGTTWRSSLSSHQWREHLLQQAAWIMEILGPDAIVMDETFAGLGYDFHPDRTGPTSPHAIEFYKAMRSLVKSFGNDKAFFSSDCSMSPFVLWADGECGDHAYSSLLGHELYTQEPVRYLAALGNKPWRPCAWHFQNMWDKQMNLARQVGSGVGVSNGWIEYTGLTRLPDQIHSKIIADIESLTGVKRS
ncbi:MAG TPA: hypothetical protein DDW27_05995 [Bacteroidales bacterium]|nr:hypothetical protein [Bacteroidales bacterium]